MDVKQTLLANSKKRIQAFETKCLRKLFRISYWQHKTDWVRSKINFLVSPQEPLLATVERRKLEWFGLVPKNSWSPTGLSTFTQPLQHISGKDHDRRLRKS